MKDIYGDKITIDVEWDDYKLGSHGVHVIFHDAVNNDLFAMLLSPELARRFAKKLKHAATDAEACN